MDLGEAWALWLTKTLEPEATLWGLQLFWWERIGKVLQLIAGATILAEIIGAPALRRFGNSLHSRIDWDMLRTQLGHTATWFGMTLRYFFRDQGSKEAENKLLDEIFEYKAATISGTLAIGLTVAFGYFIDVSDRWYWQAAATFGVFMLLVVIGCPLLILCGFSAVALAGLILDTLLIEPIAWLLEREKLDRWVKLFAFLLLLVGFHFDFLAS